MLVDFTPKPGPREHPFQRKLQGVLTHHRIGGDLMHLVEGKQQRHFGLLREHGQRAIRRLLGDVESIRRGFRGRTKTTQSQHGGQHPVDRLKV